MDTNVIATITIIIKDRSEAATKVNALLSEYGNMVIGRLGLPYPKKGLYIVTLVIDANNDLIGALTGQLGQLPDVKVKSTIAKI